MLFPSETIDIIYKTHEYVDLFWIGKLNHNKEEEAKIDWDAFGNDAINACIDTGSAFKIKNDLRKEMDQCPG